MDDDGINLEEIGSKYELAGGSIVNVARYCSLGALKNNINNIMLKDIMEGIRREFGKEGKII